MQSTRIAPTPSGHIHLGNAFNFSLTQKIAKERNANIYLRIDDFDFHRSRDEYVEDIFDSLNWLQIPIHSGPKTLEDFKNKYSLKLKQDVYKKALQVLIDTHQVYACECSRSQKERFSPLGAYLGHCREKKLSYIAGTHSLRLRCPQETSIHTSLPTLNIFQSDTFYKNNFYWLKSLGDFVLWTKEDSAAYQLMSTVEDSILGPNFIVRGEDLADSTGAQYFLAQCLGTFYAKNFSQIEFLHHSLIKNPNDPTQKYSKSQQAYSLKTMRSEAYTFQNYLKEFEEFSKNILK